MSRGLVAGGSKSRFSLMVATADGQDSNDEASGPRSVELIHKIAANQSRAKAAQQVLLAPHLQVRDRHLKLYTMDRELSERIVVFPGACKEEELGDMNRELRGFLGLEQG
jgi:hypothetical protein